MTMYMILGEGELPKKELIATLDDLWEKQQADEEDEEFWFTVQGKEEPTATDTAMVEWMASNDLYYQVLTSAAEEDLADLYAGRQKLHTAKKLPTKAVNILKEVTDQPSAILALCVNTTEEVSEDGPLYDILQAGVDAGYEVFGLNDSMIKIDLSANGSGGEETPAPAKSAAKKAGASKKAPAKKAAAATTKKAAGPKRYTREELDELELPEIKAIGTSLGITARGKDSWVNKILEKQGGEEEPEDGDEEIVTGDGVSTQGAMILVIDPSQGTILTRSLTPNGVAEVTRVLLTVEE